MNWFKKTNTTVQSMESKEYKDLSSDIVRIEKNLQQIDARLGNMEDQFKRFKGRYFREKEPEEEKKQEDLSIHTGRFM